MDLQTTTYRGRNLALLRAAAGLTEAAADPVRVLEIGPGLAVRYLGRLAGEDTRLRPFFKGLETVVRRLPLPDSWYENYESGEILQVLTPRPTVLSVLDINPRSLAVIAANLAPVKVETIEADLGGDGLAERLGLGGRFDLVVALATIGRIEQSRRDAAVANLIAFAAPGGIVVENTMSLERHDGLEPTQYPSIYRRTA